MLLSKQSLLSDAQSLIHAVGSIYSDNIIDLGAVGTPVRSNAMTRDIGPGEPIEFLAQIVDTYLASGGASTLQLTLQVATDAAFTSPVDVWQSPAVAKASLVAGYKFPISFIPDGTNKRYVRMKYTIATNDCTAGKITVGPSLGRQTNN